MTEELEALLAQFTAEEIETGILQPSEKKVADQNIYTPGEIHQTLTHDLQKRSFAALLDSVRGQAGQQALALDGLIAEADQLGYDVVLRLEPRHGGQPADLKLPVAKAL
jgi:hypothetical protein